MHDNRKWATSLGIAAIAVWGLAAQGPMAQTVDTVNYLVSDFEGNVDGTTHNGGVHSWTDNGETAFEDTALFGNSRITSVDSFGQYFMDTLGYLPESFPLGREGLPNTRSKRMGFALGDRKLSCGGTCSYDPHVGWVVNFTYSHPETYNTFDLTGATAISFWAKSDSDTVTFTFSLGIKDTLVSGPDYGAVMKVGPVWKKYTVPLNSVFLSHPGWGAVKDFNLKMVSGFSFGFNKGQNATRPTNGMSIDDIYIDNWQYVPPPIPEPEPEPEPISIRKGLRAASMRGKAPMQDHGPRIHFITPDGRKLPLDASGRISPAR